jgi:hypothetical protein
VALVPVICTFCPTRGVTFFIAGIFVGTFQNEFEKHQQNNKLDHILDSLHPLQITA